MVIEHDLGSTLVLEEQPKWKIFRDIMLEIEEERTESSSKATVLVMAQSQRSCSQLNAILAGLNSETSPNEVGSKELLRGLFSKYSKWKGGLAAVTKFSAPETSNQTQCICI
jgi:hypothetical protein